MIVAGATSSTFRFNMSRFNTGEMDMEHFLRHSTRPDRAGSSQTWRQVALHIEQWVWPPTAADADSVHGDDQWSMKTMRWVPLMVPLSALFMLVLAVLIGSRL